jgi:hypothetical protein
MFLHLFLQSCLLYTTPWLNVNSIRRCNTDVMRIDFDISGGGATDPRAHPSLQSKKKGEPKSTLPISNQNYSTDRTDFTFGVFTISLQNPINSINEPTSTLNVTVCNIFPFVLTFIGLVIGVISALEL